MKEIKRINLEIASNYCFYSTDKSIIFLVVSNSLDKSKESFNLLVDKLLSSFDLKQSNKSDTSITFQRPDGSFFILNSKSTTQNIKNFQDINIAGAFIFEEIKDNYLNEILTRSLFSDLKVFYIL